jgi:AcrR family transcriptional regulator
MPRRCRPWLLDWYPRCVPAPVTPLARPSVQLLSQQSVVAAALAILDAEGIEGLTIRRLAAECGVQGPSLYHHFASKDDILGAIVETIFSEIDLDQIRGDWEQILTGYAQQWRAALIAHPHVVQYVALRPVTSRAGLDLYEHVSAQLLACGWETSFAREVIMVVENFVFGSTLMANALPIILSKQQELEYPKLAALHDPPPADPSDDGYDLGFRALIAGLRMELDS